MILAIFHLSGKDGGKVSESATSVTFYPCFLANVSNLGMSEMPIKTMRVKHGANCIRFHNALYHDTTVRVQHT